MYVALLAEGVDRNLRHLGNYHVLRVALLAEGVDRNIVHNAADYNNAESPSSQRAWIEITTPSGTSARSTSPSSQRAWIEIT